MANLNPKENVTLIKFDIWSIVKIVLIILGLWVLYLLRDVILIVLIAGLLAAIINPIVNYFEKKKISRWLGAGFIYLGVILILILVGLAIVPAVVTQTKVFADQLPDFLASIFNKIETGIQPGSQSQFLEVVRDWLNKSPLNAGSFFSILGGVAGRIISFFMVFILAFYLSVRKTCLNNFINSFVSACFSS